jgi:hypothetical protein
MAPASTHGLPYRALARDLPETALHATSRHPTPDPRQRPSPGSCVATGVVHGDVNYPHIDGMQAVKGPWDRPGPPPHRPKGWVITRWP